MTTKLSIVYDKVGQRATRVHVGGQSIPNHVSIFRVHAARADSGIRPRNPHLHRPLFLCCRSIGSCLRRRSITFYCGS